MSFDKISAADTCEASCSYNTTPSDTATIEGRYYAVCYDKDGNVKWEDAIENLVTTVGKNATLDTILGNTAAGAVVMGLKGTGTAVVADTQSSHATWNEVGAVYPPTYSGTRKTPVFSAAAFVSGTTCTKSTSSASSFSITGTGTVAGCFINIGGSATIDNTTGVLFSAGDFSSPKAVVSGDTIAVSYSCSLT
jgi:hypothetical protein